MRLSRSSLLAFGLAAVAVAGLATWRAQQPGAPSATIESPPATAATPVAADQAHVAWHAPLPPVAPAPTAPPVAVRAPEEAASADWSALSLGVAPASAAIAPAPDAAPADLAIAMSARERRALIASAREPDGPVAPMGYRPGIAVIVPGGSHTDGVCR
jgi:hypothetical protein